MSKRDDKLSETNIVYEYKCNTGDCATRNVTYVGHTTCTLSRRLTMHLQNGSIKNHHRQYYNSKIDRSTIVENTRVIGRSNIIQRLVTMEAMFIKENSLAINIQFNNVSSLPLCSNRIDVQRDAAGIVANDVRGERMGGANVPKMQAGKAENLIPQ